MPLASGLDSVASDAEDAELFERGERAASVGQGGDVVNLKAHTVELTSTALLASVASSGERGSA